MREDQDLKFECKLKYPCGKSLRIANSSETHDQEADTKRISSLKMKDQQTRFEIGGNCSYGLRENPRKTWRAAVDSKLPMPQEKVCKQCGKVFQSIKALCGHMASHSDKGVGLKDEHSWTSEMEIDDSNSETDEAEERPKRYKKITQTCSFTLLDNDVVSPVLEQDQQELVAKCLIMLSRDSRNLNGVNNSLVESSDNNYSVVLETKSSSIDMKIPKDSKRDDIDDDDDAEILESESSDSMYFLGENETDESDVSVGGLRLNRDEKCRKSKISVEKGDLKGMNRIKGYVQSRMGSKGFDHYDVGVDSRRKTKDSSYDPEYKTGSSKKIKLGFSDTKKKKYECLNCKKTFSSYQALGGHRPCQKTTLVYSKYETGDNLMNAEDSLPCYLETKVKAKKAKGHECPFCHRVFKSGQALGGHKRSHFMYGAERNGLQTQVIKAAEPNLLDLNVAPVVDENDE